ncbi:DNA-binding transcriptional LysR family regulator [Sphingomonas sp. SORGH_AS 950]|nr:DNA-binding transcriptional LysR family regulator [Sphingomonas sp. SORGH_AS_0950]
MGLYRDILPAHFLSLIANVMTILSQLQGIAAFVHTVETGSFTAAAARMGLSKSATGKGVARLESRLGVRLLNRTTRSLSLTADGQDYYQSCVAILEELGTAEARLGLGRDNLSGTIRINLPISFGRLYCMPILTALAARHPALRLDVTFADRRVDLAEEGIDLVVRLGHPGDQSSLTGRRVAWQRSVICASPTYLERHGRPGTVDDLTKHDCLAFARDGRPLPWTVIGDDGAARALAIEPRHVISHGEALRDAVVSGLGLAYLSTWLAADDLRCGHLEALPISTPNEEAAISILWHRTRERSHKVRFVANALIAAFTPIPPWERA